MVRGSWATTLAVFIDELLIVIVLSTIVVYVIMMFHSMPLIMIEVLVLLTIAIILIVIIIYKVLKTYKFKPRVGAEAIVGAEGVVVEDLAPKGIVMVDGELWTAETMNGNNIPKGVEIVVVDVKGLTLKVKRKGE